MKRFIAVLLLVTILVTSIITVFANGLLIAPNPNAKPVEEEKLLLTTFKTCYDPINYLQIDVNGEAFVVSGRVDFDDKKYIYIRYNENWYSSLVIPGADFTIPPFDIPENGADEYELHVYFATPGEKEMPSAFYERDIVLEKQNGKWGILVDRDVYEGNKTKMSGWIDETEQLKTDAPDRIKSAAENITAKLETAYDKARAIHKYVANTLYYDLDYSNKITKATNVTAEEVYDKGSAVCEGYANLTVALLRSVGIPAVFIEGYAIGVGNAITELDARNFKTVNHAWVEAYVDGRWIVMDPTWDSKNTLENGKKISCQVDFFRFFDITPELMARTHFLIDRPNVFGDKGISEWALPESQEAYRYGLITSDCIKAMPESINRLEFCDLLMKMLSVKLGKSVEDILSSKGLSVNRKAFVDTTYFNILAANALGIVNGKEEGRFDPGGTIKRQEAAAMLQRAAVNVLGVKEANSTSVTFADEKSFADWGRDAIAFVSASVDKNGRRVMGGKENNNFAPSDLYTKEQSVLTILRLYTAY